MAKCTSPLLCVLALLAVVWRAHGQGFDLEDALDDVPTKKPKPAPKPPKIPSHGTGDFDLSDYFDATEPPKVVPKPPPRKPDVFIPTTKKPRGATNKPPKKPEPKDSNTFDLSDALDEKNDLPAGGRGGGAGGGDISDSDLDDIFNDGYKPDKGKGGGGGRGGSGSRGSGGAGETDNTGTMAETGTIAGIASALAMALISAVSGYISYQQKKFCFSIQQGLNAEYVKGENMEGVVSEEPPPAYSRCDV